MIISINWIKKYVPDLPKIDELAALIGSRLVEIESIEDLGEKYKDVIIAKVISAEKVENSDHLNLCKIDDGGVRDGVNRDENGFVQVVCGAPNVRAGIYVAWLPPESVVPETFGSEDEFKLSARKLMGNMSNGMIASLRELGLGEEHDGILEIPSKEFGESIFAGANFAELFELNDYLLEVENKSLTHRPDCFGVIGFAREVAGILDRKFENPDWFINPKIVEDENLIRPQINIKNYDLCKSYQGVVLNIEHIEENSKLNIEKTYLLRSGMRPISKVVDLTNYLMLLTGQPLHAFDYEKLLHVSNSDQAKITVRNAKNGEKLELLDGRKIEMIENDIVIAAGDDDGTAIGLAGAMGGISTEIDKNTKRIFVESATFNLYNLRNTQMRHGIFSEAITRFTKGQPAAISSPVLRKFASDLASDGARTLSEFVGVEGDGQEIKNIEIKFEKINQTLGTKYSSAQIIRTLKNVGFEIENPTDFGFRVKSPNWRTDIHIPEDIIEEVGRLNGYDNIDLTLPSRTFEAVKISEIDKLQQDIRRILVSAGANEFLSYSFVHGDLLKSVGQNPNDSYRIINSISPDLQYYRQSLLPSLLSKVNQNIRAGHNKFAIFEINKITSKNLGLTDENVPVEKKKLALVFADKKGKNAFYDAKYFAEFLFKKLGISLKIKESGNGEVSSEFEPKRSGVVYSEQTGILGYIGEFKKSVQKNMKLPESTAGFELDIEKVLKLRAQTDFKFQPLSNFQSVERDISFKLNKDINYGEILDSFADGLRQSSDIKIKLFPIDIYKNDENLKTVTLRFKIIPMLETLSGEDIRNVVSGLEETVKQFNAEII